MCSTSFLAHSPPALNTNCIPSKLFSTNLFSSQQHYYCPAEEPHRNMIANYIAFSNAYNTTQYRINTKRQRGFNSQVVCPVLWPLDRRCSVVHVIIVYHMTVYLSTEMRGIIRVNIWLLRKIIRQFGVRTEFATYIHMYIHIQFLCRLLSRESVKVVALNNWPPVCLCVSRLVKFRSEQPNRWLFLTYIIFEIGLPTYVCFLRNLRDFALL